MMLGWIQGIVFCLLLPWSETQNVSIAKQSNSTPVRLLHNLMDGYEAKLRPVRDWKKPTLVYIHIVILGILAVEEKEQILTMYFLHSQYWRDEFLQWNPMDFDNMTIISIPSETIWIPDIRIVEQVDSEKSSEHNFVYINNTGLVKYQRTHKQSFVCLFNIYFFPFDVHNCNLSFYSQLHTIEDVNLSAWRTDFQIHDIFYRQGEWELCNIYSSYTLEGDDGQHIPILTFHVTFKRHPLYYVVNLILPSLFLMILDIIGFYIPANTGDRIAFKTTLLLGYSVFLIIVMDNLPASSHATPIIDTYFILCMALLGISSAESILIFWIVSNTNVPCELPIWVRKLVLEKLSILVCRKDTESYKMSLQEMSPASIGEFDKNASSREPTTQSTTILDTRKDILENILNEIVTIRQYVGGRVNQDMYKEWLLVGYVLDKCLFWLYLLLVMIYIVSITVCWSYHVSI
ncbi:5-hydroxytryptamine receptor 3A-like [Leptodactylus fuscus]|uniref:5-hydroxytryptamine receptor 3A-like n=1 Tax=Leptodactylus fuscus TaxID=238119 RepID=UPI003F4E98A5